MSRKNAMLSIADQMGWSYTPTKKSHYRLTKQGCAIVYCSGTYSDKRALNNLKCMLRRAERGEAT